MINLADASAQNPLLPSWPEFIIGTVVFIIVFGILGILLFSLVLGMFPASGFAPLSTSVALNLHSLVLPAVSLALGLAGVLARVTRSAMLDVLQRCFADRYSSWLPKLKEMVPSLGLELSREPALFDDVWSWGSRALRLESAVPEIRP